MGGWGLRQGFVHAARPLGEGLPSRRRSLRTVSGSTVKMGDHDDRSCPRLTVPSATVVRAVLMIMGAVVGLTFLFGFGNVLSLALGLGVPVWGAARCARGQPLAPRTSARHQASGPHRRDA